MQPTRQDAEVGGARLRLPPLQVERALMPLHLDSCVCKRYVPKPWRQQPWQLLHAARAVALGRLGVGEVVDIEAEVAELLAGAAGVKEAENGQEERGEGAELRAAAHRKHAPAARACM